MFLLFLSTFCLCYVHVIELATTSLSWSDSLLAICSKDRKVPMYDIRTRGESSLSLETTGLNVYGSFSPSGFVYVCVCVFFFKVECIYIFKSCITISICICILYVK